VPNIQYEKARQQVKALSRSEKETLLIELAEELKSNSETTSIMQLQGLGKEIWANVDVQEYLDEERASWNG
jgi:hypothetical protein